MNEKLKRVVAIIALILILVFTVSFILYLFDKTLLNDGIGGLAMWSGAFGALLAVVLWLSHAFPYQQIKDEQRERIYKEAEEAERLAAEKEKKSEATGANDESDNAENAGDSENAETEDAESNDNT